MQIASPRSLMALGPARRRRPGPSYRPANDERGCANRPRRPGPERRRIRTGDRDRSGPGAGAVTTPGAGGRRRRPRPDSTRIGIGGRFRAGPGAGPARRPIRTGDRDRRGPAPAPPALGELPSFLIRGCSVSGLTCSRRFRHPDRLHQPAHAKTRPVLTGRVFEG